MFFNSNKKVDNRIDGFSHLGEGASFEGEIHCKGEIEIDLNRCFAVAESENQQGIANFIAERIDAQQKHGWMLRSFLKDERA